MHLDHHLRSWTPEALAELLAARPDLLAASDAGFDALARKAASHRSLGRCLVRADVAMLVVAQALAVSHPATPAEIDEVLGTGDVDAVTAALERLAGQAVVVIDDTVAAPVPALVDLLHRPLGLGPSFTELADQVPPAGFDTLAADLGVAGSSRRTTTARAIARRLRTPEGLERALAGAPPGTNDLVATLIQQRSPAIGLPAGFGYQTPPADDPLAWLLARGLVVAVTDTGAELPREVAMAGHPHGLAPGAALRPIEVRPVAGLGSEVVTASGADAAHRVLEGAEALLRLVAEGQVSVRRAGGVGVREVRRLAKVIDLEPRATARLLEILAEARLIEVHPGRLTPTPLVDRWWDLVRSRRWLVLVRAWVGAAGFVSSALSDDPDGRPVAALVDHQTVAAAAGARQAVIEAVASVAAGEALDPAQMAEAVVWLAPNLWGPGDPDPEELVGWTVAEAELLGLVAHHAPTPALVALAAGDDDTLEVEAAQALGTDQDQVVLQGDLTALALGPLEPVVAGHLAEMADREPGSTALPQFRFSESSVRRAFDRGWTAETVTGFLAGHALSGVPQPLTYLIGDVDRRYGSVRVVEAEAAIVTADEATAIEIGSRARAARLGLRLVAPTVLVGPVEAVALVEELRAEGFFPVLEAGTGGSAVAGAGRRDGTVGDDGQPLSLPADWTGPALTDVPLAGEIEAAVEALAADRGHHSTPDPPQDGMLARLQRLWNRQAVVTHTRDGAEARARGVVVAIDDSLTLLNEAGVEDVPLDRVVGVEDPSR